MKDKLFSGAVAGVIASGIVATLSYILKYFGLYKYTYIDIAASLLYSHDQKGTLIWNLVGWLNNFIIGIILGIILVYIMALTGKDYGLLKGSIFGLVWWFVLTVVIQPEIFEWGRFTLSQSIFANIIRDVLYGMIASYIIMKYVDLKNPV